MLSAEEYTPLYTILYRHIIYCCILHYVLKLDNAIIKFPMQHWFRFSG